MSRNPRNNVLLAGILAAASSIGACGGSTAPSPTTGLTGVVIRGPINPVCGFEAICEAPFAAGFTVQRGGRQVAQFQSDALGQYTVFLEPGPYTVTPRPDAPLFFPSTQVKAVTVGDTGLTVVRLTFDTGIR